jgi:hypothetical protein
MGLGIRNKVRRGQYEGLQQQEHQVSLFTIRGVFNSAASSDKGFIRSRESWLEPPLALGTWYNKPRRSEVLQACVI